MSFDNKAQVPSAGLYASQRKSGSPSLFELADAEKFALALATGNPGKRFYIARVVSVAVKPSKATLIATDPSGTTSDEEDGNGE
jgi:hypothetical protein